MQHLYENKDLKFEDLAVIRKKLRQLAGERQNQILDSAGRLITLPNALSLLKSSVNVPSPLALFSRSGRRKKNRFTLVEGVLLGFRAMRSARRFLRR